MVYLYCTQIVFYPCPVPFLCYYPYHTPMQSIFEFIDYRQFLAEYYRNKKESSRYFSYRYFSQKIGLNSPSFLKAVVEGKRNLTRPMLERFGKAMNLTSKELIYFKNLVFFNQAKTSAEKQEYYTALKAMAGGVKESILNSDQFEVFSDWYIPVVRELICLYDFKNDYHKLASVIKPRIGAHEANAAVGLLLRLKMVVQQSDSVYRQVAPSMVADGSVTSLAVRSFTRTMIDHSKNALDTMDKNERHISGITMGISPETYEVLTTEIEAFKDRVKIIVNNDTKSSRIYQMTLSLFPVSEDVRTIDAAQDKLS
jgi:uncharacterized protein (TIGR02147 family)